MRLLFELEITLISVNMDSIQSALKWSFVDRFFSWIPRSKLRNTRFSIIGNNCFVGGMYHKYGLKYSSPTIWTYIFPDEYLRFLGNLDWYLTQPMQFIETSKHEVSKRYTQLTGRVYPIGLLGGDVEIHFMHYKTPEEAAEKWGMRLRRLCRDNLFVVFSDSEEFEEKHLERFAVLPFEHKVFFSAKPRFDFPGTVFVRDYAGAPYIFDVTRNRRYEKYFDLTRWLNGEGAFIKS
jgi:uncharacterized protein (DUF1919 family)